MAFVEDFDVFINDDTPGYKTLDIDHVSVNGVFDDEFQESSFTESSDPVFFVKTLDITDMQQGSIAEDETGKQWEVIGIQKDGTGMAKLELRVKWYD